MEKIDEKTLDYTKYAKTHELNNAAAYLRNVAENYTAVKRILDKRDPTIPLYKEFGERGPAIVTASGPSLDEAIPHLRDLRRTLGAKIFSTVSQVWAMEEAGVRPDYVMTNDMWFGVERYLPRTNELKRVAKRITAIAHPGCWRGFFQWPGLRDTGYLFFVRHVDGGTIAPNKEGILSEVERTVLMGLREDQLPSAMAMVTSMLYANNPEIKHPIGAQLYLAPDSTVQAAMMATCMGHDPVFMVGYDLCFWKGRSRARTIEGDGTIYDGDRYEGIAETTDSGFRAAKNMLYYRTMALIYQARITMRMVEVVVDGTPGNLQHLPRAPLEDLLAGEVDVPDREAMMLMLEDFIEDLRRRKK